METRRGFLTGLAAAGAVGLAGCQSGNSGSDAEETPDADANTAATTDAGTTTATTATNPLGHPGTKGLASQPTLGPDPATATAVVVAFEDPSCPTCARWERKTFPKLRSNLVETGKASFVFRGYPVIYEWGKPAARALEATYSRNADVFWELSSHYFENQGSFDVDNVRRKTKAFLADAPVDGDAVIEALDSDPVTEAVSLDLRAGKAAGISGTPGFLLFRDGEFRTKVTGAQGYAVFENALGF